MLTTQLMKWSVATALGDFYLKADVVTLTLRNGTDVEVVAHWPRNVDPGVDSVYLSVMAGAELVPEVIADTLPLACPSLDELPPSYATHLKDLVHQQIAPVFDAIPDDIYPRLRQSLFERGSIQLTRTEILGR